jgi:hypothetical protein
MSDGLHRRVSFNRAQAKRRKIYRAMLGDINAQGLLLPVILSDDRRVEMPEPPVDFKGYLANRTEPLLLERLHSHTRDKRLTFVESIHRYYIDGVATLGSVTGLLHRFASSFEADAVIRNMLDGVRWPRPAYLKPDAHICIMASSVLVEHIEIRGLADRIKNGCLSPVDVCQEVRRIANSFPDIRQQLLDAVCLGVEEIIAAWDRLREDAAGRGTYMHQQFEYFLNRGLVDLQSSEMRMFLRYIKTLEGWAVYRTEWMIYGEEEWLAGSIDCCLIDSSGSIMLTDWKRSRGLARKYESYGKYMLEPLQHVPDCSGWRYRLQLNCYKYLLEKYYDCAVSRMCVVCTHPENGAHPYIDVVESLDAEVEAIMCEQRRLAREHIHS